jgi:hypothetical protein
MKSPSRAGRSRTGGTVVNKVSPRFSDEFALASAQSPQRKSSMWHPERLAEEQARTFAACESPSDAWPSRPTVAGGSGPGAGDLMDAAASTWSQLESSSAYASPRRHPLDAALTPVSRRARQNDTALAEPRGQWRGHGGYTYVEFNATPTSEAQRCKTVRSRRRVRAAPIQANDAASQASLPHRRRFLMQPSSRLASPSHPCPCTYCGSVAHRQVPCAAWDESPRGDMRLRQLRWLSSASVDFTREVEPSAHEIRIERARRSFKLISYSAFTKEMREEAMRCVKVALTDGEVVEPMLAARLEQTFAD